MKNCRVPICPFVFFCPSKVEESSEVIAVSRLKPEILGDWMATLDMKSLSVNRLRLDDLPVKRSYLCGQVV